MIYKDASTGRYSLMKNLNNKFEWETLAPVDFKVSGNEMHLCIPKSALGLTKDCDIDFKWADNITDNNPDIMTFITDGDVAPNGRFNYRYKGSSLPTEVSHVKAESTRFNIYTKSGDVTFSYDKSANVLIQVFDTTGRIMKNIMDKSGCCSEVKLNNGFYMAKYCLDGKCGIKKFLVN